VPFSLGRARIEGFIETRRKYAWIYDDMKHSETAISQWKLNIGSVLGIYSLLAVPNVWGLIVKMFRRFDRVVGKAIIKLIFHCLSNLG
jgi:hypothetical protein